MSIKKRVLTELMQTSDASLASIGQLIQKVDQNEISPKEFVRQSENIAPADCKRFSELMQKTTNDVIIKEIEEIKERVTKLEK